MIPLVTGQVVAFWILSPLAILAALGMVCSRKPVHSALSLAGMMICLGCLYASMDAPFLFVAQIVVYTGAVMMLFLFTMMIIGIDTTESLVETIKGHKFLSIVFAALFAVALIVLAGAGIVRDSRSLDLVNEQGNVPGLAELVFGKYVFVFLGTAVLLMIGALAAIVLAHGERITKPEKQHERSIRRIREFVANGTTPGPLPGPGVYARNNSIEYPALLPDGSVAEDSVSPTLRVRGVAIVENDGLRAVHAAALQSYASSRDELDGTSNAETIAQALDDSSAQTRPRRQQIEASDNSEEQAQ